MKTLRKRLLGAVMVAMLTLMMGVQAFAVDNASATADGVVTISGGATDAKGNAVNVVVQKVSEKNAAAEKAIKANAEALKAAMGTAYKAGMNVVDVREVVAEGNPTFPLTVSFKVPGAKNAENTSLLLYVDGKWQVVKGITVKDEVVTAKFDKLGMVAFVVEGGKKAPTTGEGATTAMAAMIVIAAAAGAFFLRRKEVLR